VNTITFTVYGDTLKEMHANAFAEGRRFFGEDSSVYIKPEIHAKANTSRTALTKYFAEVAVADADPVEEVKEEIANTIDSIKDALNGIFGGEEPEVDENGNCTNCGHDHRFDCDSPNIDECSCQRSKEADDEVKRDMDVKEDAKPTEPFEPSQMDEYTGADSHFQKSYDRM
jgi:hypothetical protein